MSTHEPQRSSDATLPLHRQHERSWEHNRFVYPVLSRRSGGISIGINLNPDKVCNFDCIYCQVDRVSAAETTFVETGELLAELEEMLALVTSGELFHTDKFHDVPPALRRLNDIAFSGDGEPTTFRNFDQIVAACAALKSKFGLEQVKLVLITNASMFHRPVVARGLEILDAHQGEIWAKLDAGTEAYYRQVERTTIPFGRILENITAAAQRRPLVIQALFMRIHGAGPDAAEQEAFCQRLNEVLAAGGRIKLVQIYTVARKPAESMVAPLDDSEVDALAALVRACTGLETAAFYGASV
ncbi:MAG: radical SAM protein [Planctomycetaceae bacterium]|nr:radical SAM protein [Planctomycetaceae bacterium]